MVEKCGSSVHCHVIIWTESPSGAAGAVTQRWGWNLLKVRSNVVVKTPKTNALSTQCARSMIGHIFKEMLTRSYIALLVRMACKPWQALFSASYIGSC